MTIWTKKLGHRTAKLLGIDLQEEGQIPEDFVGEPGHIFFEEEPTTAQFIRQHLPTREGAVRYVASLFPFISWIGHYNAQWLIGDLVAGITIGAVVVPQSLAYARLATLDVQFGLYSSFMGHLIYWIFGTSKDISIGPIAMMSVMTGKVIEDLHSAFPDVPPHAIASGLGIVAGSFIVLLGLVRCGWLIDLIPLVSLSSFVTGSAITIGSGQLASLFGITGVKTSDPPAYVIIDTLKHLPTAHGLDTAVGFSSLALLYIIRYTSGRLASRYPSRSRAVFFVATLRTVFVILLFTLISWIVNRNTKRHPHFKILMTVPAGFQNVGIPPLTPGLVQKLTGYLPAATIVLLLEHIAIAKSFGRISNYTINASQEMVAIGTGNVLGAFLGGYPATGSFSRTAIQAKAGARTPACGLITAMVVLLAIYVLPPVFYYIPSATLAAVILHAVGDLFTPPATLYRFWRIAPLEVPIFFVGVAVAVVSTIDMGIYATVGLSVALLLVRGLKARGDFLGRVRVHTVANGRVVGGDGHEVVEGVLWSSKETPEPNKSEASSTIHNLTSPVSPTPPDVIASLPPSSARNVFLPLGHGDGSNPAIGVENPYPGIFIYRFNEGFNFPGAAHTLALMTAYITSNSRPGTDPEHQYRRPGDRPWNNPTSRSSSSSEEDGRSPLTSVILDFSSVNHVDGTSIQQLVDVRNQLDRFAAPAVVDWHLACVHSRWTRRALVAAGFGYPTQTPGTDGVGHRWQSIFSVAEVTSSRGAGVMNTGEIVDQSAAEKSHHHAPQVYHVETLHVPVSGANRPLFHVDLTSALQSAVIMSRQSGGHAGGRSGGSGSGSGSGGDI
ncbi:hypothetical protein SEUCBS140593_000218 [Sporothrix eucalyptigena]|uniref:STAS domain-containing protein n=1 Tax=Sporothrix eucalyptigena TaxID=1812306 RepID=A0ABP0AL76_9PEZI